MSAQVVGPTSLGAANATVESRLGAPCAWHSVSVQGTFVASVVLEASNDGGTTWFGLKLTQASTSGTVASDVITAAGVYTVSLPVPLTVVRARCSAYTSGAALVTVASV
jgi:hypothetical protein